MLGGRYRDGIGVPQDVKRAFVLYKLAADQGDHQAQFNLGSMYAQGRGGIQSDAKTAAVSSSSSSNTRSNNQVARWEEAWVV